MLSFFGLVSFIGCIDEKEKVPFWPKTSTFKTTVECFFAEKQGVLENIGYWPIPLLLYFYIFPSHINPTTNLIELGAKKITLFIFQTQCSYVKTLSEANSVDQYLCILPHNIANQKIFLAFWFLFIVLFIVSTFGIIYRIFTLSLPIYRKNQILAKVDFGHWDQDGQNRIKRMIDNHFSGMKQV